MIFYPAPLTTIPRMGMQWSHTNSYRLVICGSDSGYKVPTATAESTLWTITDGSSKSWLKGRYDHVASHPWKSSIQKRCHWEVLQWFTAGDRQEVRALLGMQGLYPAPRQMLSVLAVTWNMWSVVAVDDFGWLVIEVDTDFHRLDMVDHGWDCVINQLWLDWLEWSYSQCMDKYNQQLSM